MYNARSFRRRNYVRIVLVSSMILVMVSWLPNSGYSQYHHLPPFDSLFSSVNIVLKDGTTKSTRSLIVNYIKQYYQEYIAHFNKTHTKKHRLNFFIYSCICDSNLININTQLLGGSGGSVNPPPPPPPGPKGSGDAIAAYSLIANNLALNKNNRAEGSVDFRPLIINPKAKMQRRTLAVMDTGLDPYFIKNIIPHIWKDIKARTIYNFLPDQKPYVLKDDHRYHHGTAVTAVIEKEFEHEHVYPQIMVLKVLDSNNFGTTFSVSCGLSYAAQHNVEVLNASLGYYPYPKSATEDPLLKKYILQLKTADIIVAAGNVSPPPGITASQLCTPIPGLTNTLTSSNLFYPACLSTTISNVISVTSVKNDFSDCPFQNYSARYVSIAVRSTKENCCYVNIPQMSSTYEGTSFATPLVSAKIMVRLLKNPTLVPNPLIDLSKVSIPNSALNAIVKSGRYIMEE